MAVFFDRADTEAQGDFAHAQVLLDEDGTGCFLCGGTLGGSDDEGYPIIFWRGSNGADVHWHASCAADFTFRIGEDVQKVKHKLSMHLAFEAAGVAREGLPTS